MLSLILALPVGSFFLLICYFIHWWLPGHGHYRPLSVVRYLRLAKILVDDQQEGFSTFLGNDESSFLGEDFLENATLKTELQRTQSQIREDSCQLTELLEADLAQQMGLQEDLLAQTERKTEVQVSVEESHIQGVQFRLQTLDDIRSQAEESEEQENVTFVTDSLLVHHDDGTTCVGDMLVLAAELRCLADQQLSELLDRIVQNTEKSKTAVEKCTNLVPDVTVLQTLKDRSSHLGFQAVILEDSADVYRDHKESNNLMLRQKVKKTGLKKISNLFVRGRKTRTWPERQHRTTAQ
jgi:hypothetical protein